MWLPGHPNEVDMTTEPFARFGELLRASRLKAGLTQEALAAHAGLSVQAIQALERGRRGTPRPDTISRLARALGDAGLPGLLDAPSSAPGGDALPERRHNLPVSVDNFIGRERDLAQVLALLQHGRLVTLVGTGGIGKTRLALAVARTSG